MNATIRALLVEREGYRRRGLTERIEAVDEALRGLGYEVFDLPETATADPVQETAAKPRGRRRKRKE